MRGPNLISSVALDIRRQQRRVSVLAAWRRWSSPTTGLVIFAAAFASLPQARAVGPKQLPVAISISLAELGYQVAPKGYLVAGATMFTVNFVDKTHLLVTFNTHALMPRLADEPPDDDDRTVAAVLLELPTGKVLARTVWRMHDHDRYLWPLQHGRFLLRIRNRLTMLYPLDALAQGNAFLEAPFQEMNRRIGSISVSPESDLLAVQTIPPANPALVGGAASAAALAATVPGYKKPPPAERPDPAVRIYLYRLRFEPQANGVERLVATQAGFLRAQNLIHIAATGDGYLNELKQSDGTFAFDFITHAGKKTELPAYLSSCVPRSYFISRSQFIAFGCLAALDKQQFSEFDLRGKQAWISAASGQVFAPYIDPAPAAGRFAYSHIITTGTTFDPDTVVPEELTGQEVTVYQNHDGRTLLKVQPTPLQRAGQNFDLSADGMQMAIVRESRVEIYNLPPLTGKDQAEVKLAEDAAPAKNDGPILLNSVAVVSNQPAQAVTVATEPKSVMASGESSLAAPIPAPAVEGNVVGDVPASSVRNPPSLYSADYPKGTGK